MSFTRVEKLLQVGVVISVIALVVTLSGCSLFGMTHSMDYAGEASYHATPVIEDGKMLGYQIDIDNGKEIGELKLTFKKKPDGSLSLTLEESSVDAFAGQAHAASVIKSLAESGVEVTGEIAGAVTRALNPAPTPIPAN